MTYESLSTLPRFNSLGVKITEAHKTGLGSSAALIASLVASLLLHFSVISPRCLSMFGDSENISTRERWELDLVHNVAQYVHCLAQGKVGSGFDISSAIYGSQIYRRFNPQIINSLMHQSAATTPEVVSPKAQLGQIDPHAKCFSHSCSGPYHRHQDGHKLSSRFHYHHTFDFYWLTLMLVAIHQVLSDRY